MFDIGLPERQRAFRQAARKFATHVRDAHVEKHISFPSRFKIAEALVGYERRVPPFVDDN